MAERTRVRIVFSKDRAAQLDLLLRSLKRNAPEEQTRVITSVSTYDLWRGYRILAGEHPEVGLRLQRASTPFGWYLDEALDHSDETVTFFCDDDVLYKPIDGAPSPLLQMIPNVLVFSLRLGHPDGMWDWTVLEPHDHGYPGSIDGHTFRTADVRRMLDGQEIPNPLILETVLAKRAGELGRPLMASYREQKLVGVDVNTVAGDQARPSGREHPQSAEELNARYLAGERISLDAFEIPPTGGCLVEVPFEWENR
jgi:hypothetical protein